MEQDRVWWCTLFAFKPSAQEGEAGGSQPGLHSELQASWGYRKTLSQKQTNKRLLCKILDNIYLEILMKYKIS